MYHCALSPAMIQKTLLRKLLQPLLSRPKHFHNFDIVQENLLFTSCMRRFGKFSFDQVRESTPLGRRF